MDNSCENIALMLRQVTKRLHDYVNEHRLCQGERLPMVTMMLIGRVSEQPGITVNELARQCGLAKSHVSRQLDLLAKQGWMEKRPDPADQRLLRLYSTEQSSAQFNHMSSIIHGAIIEVFESVSPEDRAALLQGLTALQNALEQTSVL